MKNKGQLKKKIISFLLIVLLLDMGIAAYLIKANADQRPVTIYYAEANADQLYPDKKIRILGIGNSHTKSSFRYLYKILKEAGYDPVIGHTVKDGASLSFYYDSFDEKDENHSAITYRKFESEKAVNYDNMTMEAILSDEPWDIILIQQGSDIAGQYKYWTGKDINIKTFMEKIKSYCTNDEVRTGFILNWTRAADFASENFERFYGSDHQKHDEAVHKVIPRVADLVGADYVIYTNDALTMCRNDDDLAGVENDLTRDGMHLCYGLGEYLGAYCIAATVAGLTPDSIEWYPVSDSSDKINYYITRTMAYKVRAYAYIAANPGTRYEVSVPEEFLSDPTEDLSTRAMFSIDSADVIFSSQTILDSYLGGESLCTDGEFMYAGFIRGSSSDENPYICKLSKEGEVVAVTNDFNYGHMNGLAFNPESNTLLCLAWDEDNNYSTIYQINADDLSYAGTIDLREQMETVLPGQYCGLQSVTYDSSTDRILFALRTIEGESEDILYTAVFDSNLNYQSLMRRPSAGQGMFCLDDMIVYGQSSKLGTSGDYTNRSAMLYFSDAQGNCIGSVDLSQVSEGVRELEGVCMIGDELYCLFNRAQKGDYPVIYRCELSDWIE